MQLSHHRRAYRKSLEDGSADKWLVDDNADYWGSNISLRDMEPFFASLPPSTFLTVGDGMGGKEAAFLKKLGHRAVASDICTEVLTEAKRRGIIDDFRRENAEDLSFPDGSFDYALVKGSLHHMQRPYLAIYEMLRVARKGIVIIEPHWSYADPFGLKVCLRYLVGRLLKLCSLPRAAKTPPPAFEPSGNLVLRFHPYELAQCAIAIGCAAFTYGYSHKYYEPGCERIKGAALAKLVAREARRVAKNDARCGPEGRRQLDFVAFKELPGEEQTKALAASRMMLHVIDRSARLEPRRPPGRT
jgi:SAM-dependent methyltransferase